MTKCFVVLFLLHRILATPASAAETFYQGKTLRVIVASAAGGGSDIVARLMMRQEAELTRPGAPPPVEIEDQEDLPISSAAIAAKADVFVTGDKELLDLTQIDELVILSPRQFWDKLRTQAPRRARRTKSRRSR